MASANMYYCMVLFVYSYNCKQQIRSPYTIKYFQLVITFTDLEKQHFYYKSKLAEAMKEMLNHCTCGYI